VAASHKLPIIMKILAKMMQWPLLQFPRVLKYNPVIKKLKLL
jgi:hypothetical protein